jgi:hypothetical protein
MRCCRRQVKNIKPKSNAHITTYAETMTVLAGVVSLPPGTATNSVERLSVGVVCDVLFTWFS